MYKLYKSICLSYPAYLSCPDDLSISCPILPIYPVLSDVLCRNAPAQIKTFKGGHTGRVLRAAQGDDSLYSALRGLDNCEDGKEDDAATCIIKIWALLAKTIGLMYARDTLTSQWPLLLLRVMVLGRLLSVLLDIATPYAHYLAHHAWFFLRKVKEVDDYMGLGGILRFFAFGEWTCEVFNARTRRMLQHIMQDGGDIRHTSDALMAQEDGLDWMGRSIRRQLAMHVFVDQATQRRWMFDQHFERSAACGAVKKRKTNSSAAQRSYAGAVQLEDLASIPWPEALDRILEAEDEVLAQEGDVVETGAGIGTVVLIDDEDQCEICPLDGGDTFEVPIHKFRVVLPEPEFEELRLTTRAMLLVRSPSPVCSSASRTLRWPSARTSRSSTSPASIWRGGR